MQARRANPIQPRAPALGNTPLKSDFKPRKGRNKSSGFSSRNADGHCSACVFFPFALKIRPNTGSSTMSQSLANVLLHLVFSTKDRTAWLRDPTRRPPLFAYLAGVANQSGNPAVLVGGFEDHVHLLIRLSRTQSIADLVRELKTASSAWIKHTYPPLAAFQWQAGYGVFSVSQSRVEAVCEYIRNQEEHHRRLSFQDEFLEICLRHEVQLDERYAWA